VHGCKAEEERRRKAETALWLSGLAGYYGHAEEKRRRNIEREALLHILADLFLLSHLESLWAHHLQSKKALQRIWRHESSSVEK